MERGIHTRGRCTSFGTQQRTVLNSGYFTIPLGPRIYLALVRNPEVRNHPRVQLSGNVGPLNAVTSLMIAVQTAVGRSNGLGCSVVLPLMRDPHGWSMIDMGEFGVICGGALLIFVIDQFFDYWAITPTFYGWVDMARPRGGTPRQMSSSIFGFRSSHSKCRRGRSTDNRSTMFK